VVSVDLTAASTLNAHILKTLEYLDKGLMNANNSAVDPQTAGQS
jgi:hypothetical protein